jgi:3-phenylpropionate/trans-cinnamate dioxygenase ferredoxin reductase subunit
MTDRVLQRVAAPATPDHFRDLHNKHGVELREATKLTGLVGKRGRVSGAELDNGKWREQIDLVIVDIGIRPNDDLARTDEA